MKAISQNLMHSDLKVTDGISGILDNMDVKERIAGLLDSKGNEFESKTASQEEMYSLLLDLINGLIYVFVHIKI